MCHNLIANLFEKGNSSCEQEIPEVRIKRHILEHYLKSICNITSYYGIFFIEKLQSQANEKLHQKQTDDIDLEFPVVLTECIKSVQHDNSQRTNSIFTNGISQHVKRDLQRIPAWFIIDDFVHNLDLISTSRKNFRQQISDDETIIADQTD